MKSFVSGKMRLFTFTLLSLLYFSSTKCDDLDIKIDDIFTKPPVTDTTSNMEDTTLVNIVTTTLPTGTTTLSQEVRQKINSIFTTPPVSSSTDPPITESTTSLGSTDCMCVPFYQCNTGMVNTNGEGIIDAR